MSSAGSNHVGKGRSVEITAADGKKYFFVTPEQDRKLSEAMKYLAIIPAVVKLQIENPNDSRAGSDLLPPEVYYNVTCRYEGGLE